MDFRFFKIYLIELQFVLLLTSTSAQCTNDTSCLPPSLLNGTSTSLVNCSNSQCVCGSECFELNTSSNTCSLVTSPCHAYSRELGECQSSSAVWSTALLLSLFVGPTGADNFYINRLDFAVPQLLLCLSPFCGCFSLCFYSVCAVFLAGKRKLRPLAHCMHCSALLLATLAAFLFPLTSVAWNLADIVLFASNSKNDNNNCRLQT